MNYHRISRMFSAKPELGTYPIDWLYSGQGNGRWLEDMEGDPAMDEEAADESATVDFRGHDTGGERPEGLDVRRVPETAPWPIRRPPITRYNPKIRIEETPVPGSAEFPSREV